MGRQQKLQRENQRTTFYVFKTALQQNGNDGMTMLQNTRWSFGTEWRLGYSDKHGYKQKHIGAY